MSRTSLMLPKGGVDRWFVWAAEDDSYVHFAFCPAAAGEDEEEPLGEFEEAVERGEEGACGGGGWMRSAVTTRSGSLFILGRQCPVSVCARRWLGRGFAHMSVLVVGKHACWGCNGEDEVGGW